MTALASLPGRASPSSRPNSAATAGNTSHDDPTERNVGHRSVVQARAMAAVTSVRAAAFAAGVP